MQVSVVLFEDFETLDVFGPVEIMGRLTDLYNIKFYSLQGGLVTNQHGVRLMSEELASIKGGSDIFLIPGGYGTRKEVSNTPLIELIKTISVNSTYVLTVCTGSALLAATGLLDGKKATSNKRAFEWVAGINRHVEWQRAARWTVAEKYYTSSGVSAGMDMTLGLLRDLHGDELARQVAAQIEYRWQDDMNEDDFSV